MDNFVDKLEKFVSDNIKSDGKILDFAKILSKASEPIKSRVIELQLHDIEAIDHMSNVCLAIINSEFFLPDNKECMEKWMNLFSSKDFVVIVYSENQLTISDVSKVLLGQMRGYFDLSGITNTGIRLAMNDRGFILLNEELESQKRDNEFFDVESNVNSYLLWLSDFVQSGLNVKKFLQIYKFDKEIIDKNNYFEETPFLSVITRTQGKRIEALNETLLSLMGQESLDFEVLVMAHNTTEKQFEDLQELIHSMPDYMLDRIRLIPVTGGNRSTPINRGFSEAKGEYGVILDDDDIVFDHWVSAFKKAANEHPGRVLHAYVVAQDWCTVLRKDGKQVLRACGAPQTQFCQNFNVFKELNGNLCPILGLAFPLYPFRDWGMKFDETLDTTEDWDFLMRISNLCGVVDIKEPTSMYRLWKNAENSHSLHSMQEWVDNRKKIQKSISQRPLYLFDKDIVKLMKFSEKYISFMGDKEEVTSLYFDNGSGYSEEHVFRAGNRMKFPELNYEYSGFKDMGNIKALRWDPRETGGIYLNEVKIHVYLENGEVLQYNSLSRVNSNGLKIGDGIIFYHPDPQITINFKYPVNIVRVVVWAKIRDEISQEQHDYIAMQFNRSIKGKLKVAVKKIGKRVIRR